MMVSPYLGHRGFQTRPPRRAPVLLLQKSTLYSPVRPASKLRCIEAKPEPALPRTGLKHLRTYLANRAPARG